MGYGGSRQDAGRAIGRSGDEGIDGIINEDRLGLDVIYIQAKRWEASVGRPEVQKFAGALQGQRAKKGIMITTSCFSAEARDYVGKIDNKIALIDGQKLAEVMIDHNLGVSPMATYDVKRIDAEVVCGDEPGRAGRFAGRRRGFAGGPAPDQSAVRAAWSSVTKPSAHNVKGTANRSCSVHVLSTPTCSLEIDGRAVIYPGKRGRPGPQLAHLRRRAA